ncbi:uncharacterized protein LOC128955563 [Oppia nitens]|uniref:uncharacterized protein LOC128955563 n=1 Tax=Oppia nitens TaxID=1686743 RepID=UPI0023DC5F9B|nr:uncharacterized protein LOC128955563 [Oppia nitens]
MAPIVMIKKVGAKQMVDNKSLPKTKTVWGLTVEEIEFCAIGFMLLSFVVLIIGFLYVLLNISRYMKVMGRLSQLWIPIPLFVWSFIPSGVGIYGICSENLILLMVFIGLDIISLSLYLWITIAVDFMRIGATIIFLVLAIQLLLSVLFLHNLWLHKQLFKKVLDKLPKQQSANDLIMGSSIVLANIESDINNKDETKLTIIPLTPTNQNDSIDDNQKIRKSNDKDMKDGNSGDNKPLMKINETNK